MRPTMMPDDAACCAVMLSGQSELGEQHSLAAAAMSGILLTHEAVESSGQPRVARGDAGRQAQIHAGRT